MKWMAAILILVTVVSVAAAGGPYDGKWIGTAPEAGDCGVLTVTLTITNNMIAGNVTGKHGSPSIQSGSVNPDGSAHVTYSIGLSANPFQGTARFAGTQFSGQFMTVCGIRQVTGSRQ